MTEWECSSSVLSAKVGQSLAEHVITVTLFTLITELVYSL